MVSKLNTKGLIDCIDSTVGELCEEGANRALSYHGQLGIPMPSIDVLRDFVETVKAVLFPGYFGDPDMGMKSRHYHTGTLLDRIARLLAEQAARGLCFEGGGEAEKRSADCESRAWEIARGFVRRLPSIRSMLSTDVRAAYQGDPAARSPGETIFCYPSIKALTNHRIAHELYANGCSLIPRIITEMAHSETGIDIHPGAVIDEALFIDHGTGVVIGETCRIGRDVRIYQGVTLGAKSFPLDDDGNPVKGVARHPIVGNGVIIYSGATILGRIRIGDNAVIGGNVWVTRDVPESARLVQAMPNSQRFADGAGI